MAQSVTNLKKVSLSISVLDGSGNQNAAEAGELSFVFGAASEGLSPLEAAIADKRQGDSIKMSIPQQEMHEVCGYLLPQLRHLLRLQIIPQVVELGITVKAVEDASQREIVKAVAASVGSGCGGGSCDCGCS